MIMGVYSVLDIKARSYGQLLVFGNDEMAKRAMSAPLPADNEMAKWPSDFVMYRVGTFETDNGVLSPLVPEVIASFAETQPQG